MIFIVIYLLGLLAGATFLLFSLATGSLSFGESDQLQSAIACCAVACVGGCLYCMRAVYLNKCVYKTWSSDWYIWYFLRPITSFVCGGVSFIFLKAGLLILDATSNQKSSQLGFYALAFIAGFNVDKFLAKVEEVAKATFGIEKSRSVAQRTSEKEDNG